MKLFSNKLRQYFTNIYENNLFNGDESISGTGSSLYQTRIIRKEIPILLKNYKIKKMIDAPCGDFNWMQHTDLQYLDKYIGVDIVKEIIKQNNTKYSNSRIQFKYKNICVDRLPASDLVFCRDLMNHLNYKDINKALANLKRSKITFLLLTTFTQHQVNNDLKSDIWRPLNFEMPPFNFPKPIQTINEGCTEDNGVYTDKSLSLWQIDQLPMINIA